MAGAHLPLADEAADAMRVLAAAEETTPEEVVATLRIPLPVGTDLLTGVKALQGMYGARLFLLPTSEGDEFVKIARQR